MIEKKRNTTMQIGINCTILRFFAKPSRYRTLFFHILKNQRKVGENHSNGLNKTSQLEHEHAVSLINNNVSAELWKLEEEKIFLANQAASKIESNSKRIITRIECVQKDIQSFVSSSGYEALEWRHENWNQFTSSKGYHLPTHIRMGSLRVPELGLPALNLPALLPLSLEKNIIIHSLSTQHENINLLFIQIICRLLAIFPAGYLIIYMFDLKDSGVFNSPNPQAQAWTKHKPAIEGVAATRLFLA